MRVMKALVLGSAFWAGAALAADLAVKDAWIREAPANAPALGAFAALQNTSDKTRQLVAVHGTVADKLELHKTIMEGSLAKMVPQDAIEVPAQGEVKLQPGGLHIMLIEPKQALKAGDKVELVLEFDGGVSLPVSFEVRRSAGMAMDHGNGMKH